MRELTRPVLVRRSTPTDVAALARLASLNAKSAPRGVYLVAEVGGEIVAAVPLDARTAMLHDPSHPTADIRELLRRWARSLRREASMVDSKAA